MFYASTSRLSCLSFVSIKLMGINIDFKSKPSWYVVALSVDIKRQTPLLSNCLVMLYFFACHIFVCLFGLLKSEIEILIRFPFLCFLFASNLVSEITLNSIDLKMSLQ